MKANELRIGNCVLFSEDSTVFVVKTIEEKWLEVKNEEETSWISSEELGPIPLTEEWLLKFGFEKYEFDNGQPNQYRLSNRLVVIRDNKFVDYGTSVFLQYVHQLQNLYFAITGEELTE